MTKPTQELVAAGQPSANVQAEPYREPVPQFTFGDMQRMAVSFAKSGMFGVKDPDQALSLLMIAQADGLHPATAARDYSIIQGQAAKKAEAILRDYQRSGGRVEWHERTDAVCSATFRHPSSTPLKVDWTIERATKAGLAKKDNWQKYPRAMLHARCVSEGCRATAPGSTGGMYTPEEIGDFEQSAPEATSITAAIEQTVAAQEPNETEAYINAMDVPVDAVDAAKLLEAAFAAAWQSTKDKSVREKYKGVYESMKAEIALAQGKTEAQASSGS